MKPYLIVFILVLSGCASSSVQLLSAEQYPSKNSECPLDVFTSESKVTKKYKEIAIITHKTKQDAFSDKGASSIIPELKEEACKLGADGLIVRSVQQGTWGEPGHGEAIAFKYQ